MHQVRSGALGSKEDSDVMTVPISGLMEDESNMGTEPTETKMGSILEKV